MTAERVKTILDSASLDPIVRELFQLLIEEIKELTKSVIQLQSSVPQRSIKTNELERHNSKNSVIFNNLPLGITGTLIGDVSYFCSKVLNISVTENDLNACHPLYSVQVFNKPPPIISKSIRFNKKNSLWNPKPLLRNFVNPCKNKPVYVNKRLSKYDSGLKNEAESRCMIVST